MQRLEFAQQEQSEDVVEIGISQRHACDGRLAQAIARMQIGCCFDLGVQVRRGAQQEPQEAVLGERNLRLSAWLALEGAGPHSPTICAGAVPLRKRASGR